MDNNTWDLSALYKGLDDSNFKNDCSLLITMTQEINSWSKKNLDNQSDAGKKIETYINLSNRLGDLSDKLFNFVQLSVSTDAKNDKAFKVLDKLETTLSDLVISDTLFKKFLSSLDNIDSLITSSALLKGHEFYLKEIISSKKYTLSEKEELVIAKMQPTSSMAFTKLQELLTSTLMVNININGDQKRLPLSAVRNLAYENDETLRKTAYESELLSLKHIDDSSCACLNSIKGEVLALSSLRGYESPLYMTLENSRLTEQTLKTMLECIKESLPVFNNYLTRKGELLGHKSGLPFYDLFAPIGKTDMRFTYKEAQKYILDNFYSFSKSLGDYAKKAFENNWIDVEPKEGKRGGAFCSNLHSIGESRILTNFTGSFSDVITLAHELGHGYHGDCLKDEYYLNSDYPMPIAETASTFCETIVKKSAIKASSKEESLSILENDISDSTQVIVDILSRFIFEDTVFKKRKDGPLSVEELNDIMLTAQKETYGSGLNQDFLHKYMWIIKPHYYDANFNYYNFPYAFGLLFAKGLYSVYLDNKASFPDEYRTLLSVTGKNSLEDIASIVNIDITDKSFWKKSLKVVEEEIKEFLSLTK